jgi:hypothetical protein
MTTPDAPSSLITGSRSSAHYDWLKKQVFLSQNLPSEALPSLSQLEMHELLGALHYNDHTYAISTALEVINQAKTSAELAQAEKGYESTIFAKNFLVADDFDGGSSVQGGGDLRTLFIKMEVLHAIVDRAGGLSQLSSDFLLQYPKIDFEPITNKEAEDVVLDYRLKSSDGHSAEQFAVFVPLHRWQREGATRATLLQEIERKVLEIFPAKRGVGTNLMEVKPFCAGGASITFPATTDPQVRSLQIERAALLSGCFHDPNENFEMQVPSEDARNLPLQAATIYLDCAFKIDGRNYDYQESIATAILPAKRQIDFSVDTIDLLGIYRIDAAGTLDAIAIGYKTPGQFWAPKLGQVNSSSQAEASLSLLGHQINFICRMRK